MRPHSERILFFYFIRRIALTSMDFQAERNQKEMLCKSK